VFDPGDYRYDTPTASVFDDLGQYIPLILSAIDAELGRSDVWLEGDEDTALAYIEDLRTFIAELEQTMIPLGGIIPYAGSTPPSGFLLCDGSLVSETTYAALFALIGDTYAPTTPPAGLFWLPDLRGRAPIGTGDGAGLTERTLGEKVGNETHILITAELATHSHGISQTAHSHGITQTPHTHGAEVRDPSNGFGTGVIALEDNLAANAVKQSLGNSANITINNANANITINDQGSSNPHNNMQPSLALNYVIRAV
jgi:microcystin-dependent protein